MPIAKNRATAVVGDKLWVCDPNNRGEAWSLAVVTKIARTYLYVEGYRGPLGTGFAIASGTAKSENGFTPRRTAHGSDERTALRWDSMRWDLAKLVQECRDPAILREVALAFEVPSPPNFSVDPA